MLILAGFWFFMFGTFIGSFLNVVVNRFEIGESLGGRSHCPHCNGPIYWYDLVPIASYIALRAQCRHCRKHISLQYPLVELLTGVLFLGVFVTQDGTVPRAILLIISAFLVAILAYDMKHTIIPDEFVYPFIILSGVFACFVTGHFALPSLLVVCGGPLLFLPFALLWFFSNGRAMGFGDAKLAWGIGWLLGPLAGLNALILAFWSGALVGVTLLFLPRLLHRIGLFQRMSVRTMKSEVPFAPFLIFGLYCVLLTGWSPLTLFL